MRPNHIYFLTSCALLLLLASCGESNKFASSFGKRRYTKGYYVDVPSSVGFNTANTRVAKQAIEPLPTISKGITQSKMTAASSDKESFISLVNNTSKPIIAHEDHSFSNKVIAADTASTNVKEGAYKHNHEINYPAIAGFAFSVAAVIVSAIAHTFTPLAIVLGSIAVILCVYSFFLHRTYANMFGALGLILLIIMFTLIVL